MNCSNKPCLLVIAAAWSVLSLGCSLPIPEPEQPLFELQLYGADGLSFSDNLNGQYDDSKIDLGEALERAQHAVPPDKFLLVRVVADDAVTYGRLKTFIGLFLSREIRNFELQFADEATYPFEALSPARPGMPDVRDLAPFVVRLQADETGMLDSIRIDGRQVESFHLLRSEMIARIGDERGPGSIADTAVVVMEANDDVRVLDLRQAYEAVAGYLSGDGEFVPLVQTILPMQLDAETDRELEFEEVDDFSLQLD